MSSWSGLSAAPVSSSAPGVHNKASSIRCRLAVGVGEDGTGEEGAEGGPEGRPGESGVYSQCRDSRNGLREHRGSGRSQG